MKLKKAAESQPNHQNDACSKANPIKNRGIGDASRNAIAGFWYLLSEPAARRELFFLALSIMCTWHVYSLSSIMLIFISVLMLVVEALNTAIENLCDIHTTAYDERIKNIKDLGAAAVLILAAFYAISLAFYLFSLAN